MPPRRAVVGIGSVTPVLQEGFRGFDALAVGEHILAKRRPTLHLEPLRDGERCHAHAGGAFSHGFAPVVGLADYVALRRDLGRAKTPQLALEPEEVKPALRALVPPVEGGAMFCRKRMVNPDTSGISPGFLWDGETFTRIDVAGRAAPKRMVSTIRDRLWMPALHPKHLLALASSPEARSQHLWIGSPWHASGGSRGTTKPSLL
jgi:hypothetical protein